MTWRKLKANDAISDYALLDGSESVHGKRPRLCRECEWAHDWRSEGTFSCDRKVVRERSSVTHVLDEQEVDNPFYVGLATTWCGRYLVFPL